MELSEAKEYLDGCIRDELQDHAFGDAEVFWKKDGHQVAGGYFSGAHADVWFSTGEPDCETTAKFEGPSARELRYCGTEGGVTRNDETGPDEYAEGTTLPGLTLEGVLTEITTPPPEIIRDIYRQPAYEDDSDPIHRRDTGIPEEDHIDRIVDAIKNPGLPEIDCPGCSRGYHPAWKDGKCLCCGFPADQMHPTPVFGYGAFRHEHPETSLQGPEDYSGPDATGGGS